MSEFVSPAESQGNAGWEEIVPLPVDQGPSRECIEFMEMILREICGVGGRE